MSLPANNIAILTGTLHIPNFFILSTSAVEIASVFDFLRTIGDLLFGFDSECCLSGESVKTEEINNNLLKKSMNRELIYLVIVYSLLPRVTLASYNILCTWAEISTTGRN